MSEPSQVLSRSIGAPLALVLGLVACGTATTGEAPRAPDPGAQIAAIRENFAKQRRYSTCEERRPAGSTCGLLADDFWSQATLLKYIETSCPGLELKGGCWMQLRGAWYRALFKRYPRTVLAGAPVVVCEVEECPSPVVEEVQMLRQYNAQVAFEEGLAIAAIERQAEERQWELDREQREQQRRWEAAAETLKAAADVYRSPGSSEAPVPMPTQGATAPSANTPGGCQNDHQCGVGFVCAKDSFAFRGVCARAVNEYGVPQMRVPNPASIGAGTGTCQFDTSCPIGFRCVKSSGGLYGNCMK